MINISRYVIISLQFIIYIQFIIIQIQHSSQPSVIPHWRQRMSNIQRPYFEISHISNSKLANKSNTGPPDRGGENIKPQPFKSRKQTKAQMHIKNILTNKILFQQSQLDQTIFKSDLVIEMQVPQQSYIKRTNKMELGSIVRRFRKSFQHAYENAYLELYNDMADRGDQVLKQNNNDKELLIRQFASFIPLYKSQVNRRLFNYEVDLSDREEDRHKKIRKVVLQATDQQQKIILNCQQEYSGILDAFIISYNTLIYTLQQFCGFKVKSFLVSTSAQSPQQHLTIKTVDRQSLDFLQKSSKDIHRKIFILLYLPDDHMIKAGNKYSIKKQIDYTQIDPFINDPMDEVNRPLRYNKHARNYLLDQGRDKNKNESKYVHIKGVPNEQQNDIKHSASAKSVVNVKNNNKVQTQPLLFKRRKTIDRKLGFNLPDTCKGRAIINEVKLTPYQLKNFQKFCNDLNTELQQLVGEKNKSYDVNLLGLGELQQGHNCFNDPQDIDAITHEEKDYLYRVNRFKYNLGVQKKYVQIKKQRKYFQILRKLSKKHGYATYDVPVIYSQFKLAAKNKNFFHRLSRILLYKEILIGPYGQLNLFNKMQRIKLAYSVLREHVRVENLYMLKTKVYALSDEYEKFGKIGQRTSNKFHYQYHEEGRKILKDNKGGLNGRTLQMDWHHIFIWRTDFATIRNYLGESKAFQVFIKTSMIYLFVFLTPMGIIIEIIKKVFIQPQSSVLAYFPQFWFYISYMLFITIVYGIFIEKYRRAEQNYIRNFVEETPTIQFINQYRGPYMRDIINDNANTYNQKYIYWKDQLKTYLIFFLFFMILGAQIGFYYGIRAAIVDLSYQIPQFDTSRFYLLRPIQLIGYSIFFVTNAILYKFIISPLAIYLTKFQNKPTKQAFIQSENLKLYIFCIGIQIIGPIDLVYIQYAAKTSCSSDWCFKELEAYVYCRYILMIAFVIFSAFDMLRRFFKNNKIKLFEKNQKIELTYSRKLALFLEFVYQESKKDPCVDIKLVDQTVALIQFATFLTVFPLGAAISFVSMLIDYNVERMQILQNQQRPIPKSQLFQPYRKVVVAIGHWMLFFNFSQMFITLQWLEYLFQNVVLHIVPVPTPYAMMTLKYAVILFFMIIYEIILEFVIRIVQKQHSVMDFRKWNMWRKFGIRNLNLGGGVTFKLPKPIHAISRTFNVRKCYHQQQIEVQQENQDQNGEDIAQQFETYGQIRAVKNNPKLLKRTKSRGQ